MNRLPEVRRFLKEPGHADAYEGLKINWKPGKPPILSIFGEDGSTETVDLSKHSTDEIHDLLAKKGFERKAAGTKSEDLRVRAA